VDRAGNPFELFGLPLGFAVDRALLDERLRALSQQHHPDRLTQASARERIASLEMTTRINDGYLVLRDPSRRAAALMKLLGVDLDREGQGAHQMAPAFLMDILDLREQLDDKRQQKDVEGALALGREVAKREQATYAELERDFALQFSAPTPARLQVLADKSASLRYFKRFQDEVAQIEEESLS
jgi:molecular chaperone HscB